MPKGTIQTACPTIVITIMPNKGEMLYSGNKTESWLQEQWNGTLFTEKPAAKLPWGGSGNVLIKESISQIILWSCGCTVVKKRHRYWCSTYPQSAQLVFSGTNHRFIWFCCLQAFPELPEDVLRVHADVVQRSCLAQYNPPDNSQSAARCGEEGHLEGIVAHHYWTYTGEGLHTLHIGHRLCILSLFKLK